MSGAPAFVMPPCVECGQQVPEPKGRCGDRGVYFGIVGPFCDTKCRDKYIAKPINTNKEV